VRTRSAASRDVLDKLGLSPGHAVVVVGQGDKRLLARVRGREGQPADLILFWPRRTPEITTTP
jgi:hypothetical protein